VAEIGEGIDIGGCGENLDGYACATIDTMEDAGKPTYRSQTRRRERKKRNRKLKKKN
jgi:hypothetical protein